MKHEKTKADMLAKIARLQQFMNDEFLQTHDFRVAHDNSTLRYVEAALSTPNCLKRYKINLNCCFECSQDSLS